MNETEQKGTPRGPIRQSAMDYIARGWAVVPIPARSKGPRLKGWQDLRLTSEQIPQYFKNGMNIGILLGEPSGGLVDVDLDVREATLAAPVLLPPTGLVHGRASRPKSHHWYLADPVPASRKWQDLDGTVLCELRTTSAQTVVPPSIHPDGDRYQWDEWGEPSKVSADALSKALGQLAAAALLGRHWPAPGGRQDAALALSGGLARDGWEPEAVGRFLLAVAQAAGDEETAKRVKASEATERRLQGGGNTTGWTSLARLVGGAPVIQRLQSWLGCNTRPAGAGQAGSKERQHGGNSQASRLIALADTVEFFHTHRQEPFAAVPVNGHSETWPIYSKGFRGYLCGRFYRSDGAAPSSQALQDALNVLSAKACFDGPEEPVNIRLAESGGNIYLDLGNPQWQAAEITTTGWRVVDRPPVRFRHPAGMKALPQPVAGGRLEDLRRFINVADESDWTLLVAWALAALRPTGPYTVLLLHGEQGSAKSTTARVLRDLIDPNAAPLRAMPQDNHDLMIAATNGWLVALDNLSTLPPWLSDAVCRLATGGGFATRELYSDTEEVLLDVQRPVLLTGIDELAVRGDLLDRAVTLYLPPISGERRQLEEEMLREFAGVRPLLLGAMLDTVVGALGRAPGIRLANLPRMADFTRWGAAVAEVGGNRPETFLAAYARNRASATEVTLEAHPIAEGIMALARTGWSGSPTALLEDLKQHAGDNSRQRDWPRNAAALSSRLRRIAPSLRARGVEVEFGREANGNRPRYIHLALARMFGETVVPAVPAVLAGGDDGDGRDGVTEADSGETASLTDSVGWPLEIPGIGPKVSPEPGRCHCGVETRVAYRDENGQFAHFCLIHARLAGLPVGAMA